MRAKYIISLIIPALLLVGSVTLLAQTDAGACPALVEQALGDLGTNCDALDRNSACYGFNRVNATFVEAQAEDFFSNPADRTELVALDTIETAALDAEAERWGIAVLNVQANVPNTLPGQAVVFLLMGDTQVENAVAPEDALELGAPIDVTTLVAANVRSSPSTTANVVGSVPEGTTLPADALSTDEEWLRVLFEGGAAWINRDIVDEVGDASTLPIISRDSRTPMQAFNFRTGVGEPACVESPPSLLMIQGPDNVRVDITANGADIQIASTIVLWLLPNNQMQLVVINGSAEVGGVIVPKGFTLFAPLNDEGQVEDDGDWTGFRALTPEELALLLPLELIPEELLHYRIIIPTLFDIQSFLANLNAGQTQGGAVLSGPAARQVACSDLAPTSPLGGMAYGRNTFYWDAAAGATSYRVNVYDENGTQVASGEVDAPTTNLTLDVLGGSGFFYSWEVSALVNGQLACTTARITMQRSAPPPPPEPGSPTTCPAMPPSCNMNYICERCLGESMSFCPSDCLTPP
jgi:hypothetical protein